MDEQALVFVAVLLLGRAAEYLLLMKSLIIRFRYPVVRCAGQM